MAIQFIDSFDHYTLISDKWDAENGTDVAHCATNAGRFSLGAYHNTGFAGGQAGAGTITKHLPDPQIEMIVGFAWFFEADASTKVIFRNSTGSVIGGVYCNSTSLKALDKDGATVSTAALTLTNNTWQFIECRVKSHATLGEIEIRVNQVIKIALTTEDTRGGDIAQLHIDHGTKIDDSYIDDLYILDTVVGAAHEKTFTGDVRVTVLRPKANGTEINFTPTEATNWESTDDALHDGDTSYVEAGQFGATDNYENFTFADVGISPATIYGVQVVNATKKTDAGALRYTDNMVIAGTYYASAEVTANSAIYSMSTYPLGLDPSDAGIWTESKVAAVGSGFTITFREV